MVVETETVEKPLKERLKSKLWKVKKTAFDELNQMLKDQGAIESNGKECLEDYESYMTESNPSALESIL